MLALFKSHSEPILIHGEIAQHANLNSSFHGEIGTIPTKLLPLTYLEIPAAN